MNEIILEIIKFSIPALIVFFTVYFMLTNQAKKEEKMKVYELKMKHGKDSLPLRLQAYERVTLLMYRIAPENLIPRTQNASMDVKMLSFALMKTIKSEFEHNITQQVYLSTPTWQRVERYKEDLIRLIKKKTIEFKPEVVGIELSQAILEYVIAHPEELDYQEVMSLLKKEVKEMFV